MEYEEGKILEDNQALLPIQKDKKIALDMFGTMVFFQGHTDQAGELFVHYRDAQLQLREIVVRCEDYKVAEGTFTL